MDKIAASLVFLLHSAVVLLFAMVTRYGASGVGNYAMFQDIHVMVAVGFGFVLAFLYKNAFTTVGHSFLLISFVALWAIINVGFWNKVFAEVMSWTAIDVSLWSLITADYAAMAVLISFGAVVGRLSAQQLIVLALFEVIFYSFNQAVAWQRYYVADIGGAMLIHTFGAYFGLAASAVLDNEEGRKKIARAENKASKESNTFALIGTLFLWCFFPAFNSALARNQELAVVNTYLSIAGALSVIGFAYVQPQLNAVVEDSYGVHNVHGLPGIFGGIVSVIVARKATALDWSSQGVSLSNVFGRRAAAGVTWDPYKQANFQLATLGTTLAIALAGGAFTGILIRELPTLDAFYDDATEWQHEGDVKA